MAAANARELSIKALVNDLTITSGSEYWGLCVLCSDIRVWKEVKPCSFCSPRFTTKQPEEAWQIIDIVVFVVFVL